MRSLLVLSLIFVAAAAQADIPNPQSGIKTTKMSAAESETLYNAIPGQGILVASLRTLSQTAKVKRSADGLNQIVCIKTVQMIPKAAPTVSCTAQKSTNGKKLPIFKPAIKMG